MHSVEKDLTIEEQDELLGDIPGGYSEDDEEQKYNEESDRFSIITDEKGKNAGINQEDFDELTNSKVTAD